MANSFNYSQSAIDNLEKSQDDLENSLQDSPSTYSSSLDTSKKDVQTEIRLRSVQSSLDKLQAKKINEQWYGKGKSSKADVPTGTSQNPIFQGLDALARPLYAVAGAAKYLAGDHSNGFVDTVNKNITTDKSTFGDILSQKGAPKAVSAPLGFALDVAFDPVNWLTMGTSALVPKIGYGLVKGAAGDAVKESAYKVASTVGKFVPGVSKSGFVESMADKALQAGESYNNKIGKNVLDVISKRAQKSSVGDYLESAIGSLPGGDWVVRNFSYSPEEWFRVAKIKDQVETAAKGRGGILEPIFNKETGLRESPDIGNIAETLKEIPSGDAGILDDTPISKMSDIVNKPVSEYDNLLNKESEIVKDGVDLSDKYANLARSKNSIDQMQRMLGEANIDVTHREIVKALNELGGTISAPNAYDKLISNVRGTKIGNVEIGKNILDSYNNFIGMFKSAKIGFLSPSSVTNAAIGNPLMLHMNGNDITRKAYFTNVKKAWNFVGGKNSSKFFKEGFLGSPEWQDYIKNSAGTFQKTFGFSGDKVLSAKQFVNEAMAKAPQLAGGDKYKAEEIKKVIDDIFKNKQSELSMGSSLKYSSGVKSGERATDIASQELTDSSFLRLKEDLAEMAEGRPSTSDLEKLTAKNLTGEELQKAYNKITPGEIKQKASQALSWALTKPSESYSRIDQSFKLGTALTMVQDGVTEKELMRMTKSIIPGTRGANSIEAKDILNKYSKNGQYYYRLTPEKATEIVNNVYMNYAAMPAAVKVLRSIPVLGSPFFSFSYAMAAKMGQTALSNPAAYNKITFGLHEASGNKTPLEKKALKSENYNFYNDPGMIKLPFFQENPLYLNVANMIPYYNMNMFAPSERKYNDSLGDKLVSVLDKTPILKDPVGQVMFDYFIQPLIIKDSLPQGSFGQQLYPSGTSALGKIGYATRAIAEAPLPTAAAALAPVTPESALDYVPSYRWRQLGYALKGKTPLGAPAKEDATTRTLRALGSMVGAGTQPLDLDYAAKNVKK